jgi:aspartyl-tRNA(Asn)/glutamyl-tRNA(Gln) amidotransferase subunit B
MEQGSLRVDANLSVRRPGDPLGTKTEVKNMNSFANVERALTAERERQIELIEGGGRVTQVTLTFNAATGEVKPLRTKEDSHDYRYFPDPDLPPLVLDHAFVHVARAAVPELPAARRERYENVFALSRYDAQTLIQEPPVARYFEAVVAAGGDPKTAANWVLGDVLAGWNESGAFAVTPERLVALVAIVADGTVSLQAAKRIYAELSNSAETPRALAEQLGLMQVRDEGALAAWIEEVIAAHPAEVARFKGGETKLTGFFVGQVMKRSGGTADPKKIQPILSARLAE